MMMRGHIYRTRHFVRTLGALTLIAVTAASARAEPVPVVATFSVIGDMVKQIGGERIALTVLVGPDGDTHVYQPSPADARAVAKARLLVVNGLGYEGWMERLLEAASFDGVLVTTTDGINAIELDSADRHHEDSHKGTHGNDEPGHTKDAHEKADKHRDHHDEHKADTKKHAKQEDEHKDTGHGHHDHGTHDPHGWQDPTSAQVYVRNIARGLSAVDPANAAYYQERLTNYLKAIQQLDAEIKSAIAELPANRRTIVTSHDAFQYFGRAYGLTFLAPQGLSTESEASANDVARLIRQLKDKAIKAVFVENLSDPRLIERIADETGAVVGGKLYTGALSPLDGPAATYLEMLRTNTHVLRDALKD